MWTEVVRAVPLWLDHQRLCWGKTGPTATGQQKLETSVHWTGAVVVVWASRQNTTEMICIQLVYTVHVHSVVDDRDSFVSGPQTQVDASMPRFIFSQQQQSSHSADAISLNVTELDNFVCAWLLQNSVMHVWGAVVQHVTWILQSLHCTWPVKF